MGITCCRCSKDCLGQSTPLDPPIKYPSYSPIENKNIKKKENDDNNSDSTGRNDINRNNNINNINISQKSKYESVNRNLSRIYGDGGEGIIDSQIRVNS